MLYGALTSRWDFQARQAQYYSFFGFYVTYNQTAQVLGGHPVAFLDVFYIYEYLSHERSKFHRYFMKCSTQ